MQSFISDLFSSFKEGASSLMSSPYTMMAMGILLILVILLVSFKRVELSTRKITFVGIIIAISFVLNLIVLFRMPQGGSVTLGSMVPILLLSFYYGPELGFLAGFVFGLINLLNGGYILHPVQVLFDYPLPFMMLGLAGFFRLKPTDTLSSPSYVKKILCGVTIATLGRLLFHWLSGVIFFADYAEGMPAPLYSLVYNGSFLAIEFIIAVLILIFVPFSRIMKNLKM